MSRPVLPTDFATAPEIIVRDNGTTTDLGYPWSVQLDARRILIAHYFKAAGEIQPIAGTILRLDYGRLEPKSAAQQDRISRHQFSRVAQQGDQLHRRLARL